MNRILTKPGYRLIGEMMLMASAITLIAVWIGVVAPAAG